MISCIRLKKEMYPKLNNCIICKSNNLDFLMDVATEGKFLTACVQCTHCGFRSEGVKDTGLKMMECFREVFKQWNKDNGTEKELFEQWNKDNGGKIDENRNQTN